MMPKREFERAWRKVLTSMKMEGFWPLDEQQLKDIGGYLDNLNLLVVDGLLSPAWNGEISLSMNYSCIMEQGSEHAVSVVASKFWYTTWIAREVLFNHRQPSFTKKTLPVRVSAFYLPSQEGEPPIPEVKNPFYGLGKKSFPEVAKAWKAILGEIPLGESFWFKDEHPQEMLTAGNLIIRLNRVYAYELAPGDIAINLTFERGKYSEIHALLNALEWFCVSKMMKKTLWEKNVAKHAKGG